MTVVSRTRHLLLCAALALASVGAQGLVEYRLRFPAPQTHYVEVTASLPVQLAETEFFMPVWTPGSYLVREFARNVEALEAHDLQGRTLPVLRTAKDRWRVSAGAERSIELSYRVYAYDSSVQGNCVDAGFAMLNGAANFVTPVGEKRRYEVRVELPSAWKESISGMKLGSTPNSYVAADYDELVDSPIYAGNAPIHEFEVDGKKHYLVNEGEGPMWDGPASARDVAKIVSEYRRQWGFLPYDKYVFFNMLVESGGGLEHKNSTWMNASRWGYGNTSDPPDRDDPDAPTPRRQNRIIWLGLVSHEYFHLWNVKRLRPVELGPFNYETEVPTRSLWLAEGVTSYYGPLAVRRAGLSTRDQYLRSLSRSIRALQTTPGRLVTPAEQASFNAWIQLYRPNENTPNTAISYYTKGEIIGFLLDAKIRKATNGAKSLDDAMRTAYERYSGERGYTPEQFRAVVSETAGADLRPWLVKALETTEELEFTDALDWYGLRFKADPPRPGMPPRLQTGITTRTDEGRIIISGLRRSTPAYDAGFSVGDEIVAVNGYRVRPSQWPSRLDSYKPGDTVEVLVARRDELVTFRLPLVLDKPESWTLELRSDATPDQIAHLKSWLRE